VKRLVVNADDFGLSAGVNRGILEAHAAGVVTSASLMVNTPGFAAAAAAARGGGAPRLGVGLHLNLTIGAPVSPPESVRSLCGRDGRLQSHASLVARALAGRLVAREVEQECAAQIARARAAGVRLTHLDGHLHAHALPGVWRPVLAAARAAGINVVRLPLEPAAAMAWRPLAAVGQVLLSAAYRIAASGTGGPVPRHASHFRGFALTGRRDFKTRLLALLDQLDPGGGVTELMVHPGYVDADLAQWARYVAGREVELAALLSADVRERLGRGDIELVDFGAA
jgi:predicted glycoside hydrolase/deacetylase ChbG (UPF0249 family)